MPFRLLAHAPAVTKSVDLGVTPITTAAWLQISASLPKACSAVEIFNPSGASIKISTGVVGQEDNFVAPYTILPGGSSILLPLEINGGKPISVKAIDQNAAAGLFTMNFFG